MRCNKMDFKANMEKKWLSGPNAPGGRIRRWFHPDCWDVYLEWRECPTCGGCGDRAKKEKAKHFRQKMMNMEMG